MPKLLWNEQGQKRYHNGFNNGVLYTKASDGRYMGVPWNGFLSAEINPVIKDPTVVYQNGMPMYFSPALAMQEGSLTAYTYPDEFGACIGSPYIPRFGLTANAQNQTDFRLSFETHVGDDVGGPQAHRQIHLLYNLLAVPESRNFTTLSNEPEAEELSWSLYSVPEITTDLLPTSHIVFDSRRMPSRFMEILTDTIYGTDLTASTLPSLQAIIDRLKSELLLIINDNGDGTWTAETDGDDETILQLLDDMMFSVDRHTVVNVNNTTFTAESG